jgi:hypothetical protein
MKAILGSLLCLVLFASECFALKGGPPYPGGTNIVGTYAGVLLPTSLDPNDIPPSCPGASNSLGVFTLGVPSSGGSTGNFIMFSQGRVFGGTIQGIADPQKARLDAIINATFTYSLVSLTGEPPVMITATALGTVDAVIRPPRSGVSAVTALLRGSAQMQISQGFIDPQSGNPIDCDLSLDVMGFKQSSTPPAGSDLVPPS